MTDSPDYFRKTDLHIHTPESVCYSDSTVSAGDIVRDALAAELDIIAVTDHNTVAGIDGIRDAARNSGLVILPGVELTTGHGHFLALFDVNTDTRDLEDFLDYVGIDKNGRGDAHTVAGDEIESILQKIREREGIAVAAHIDRWPSGFLETKDTRKRKQEIHENEYLDALEITIPQNRQDWEEGRVRGYPMKRACLQGSDAHNPAEIARRPVYIKMEHMKLSELKKAIENYRTDILFPDDIDG